MFFFLLTRYTDAIYLMMVRYYIMRSNKSEKDIFSSTETFLQNIIQLIYINWRDLFWVWKTKLKYEVLPDCFWSKNIMCKEELFNSMWSQCVENSRYICEHVRETLEELLLFLMYSMLCHRACVSGKLQTSLYVCCIVVLFGLSLEVVDHLFLRQ